MKIIRSLASLTAQPSIVTIGNFDGVHRGHQHVIANLIARARTQNARAVAITFDPHPAHVLYANPKDYRLPLITPLPEKLKLLAQTGLDLTLVLPFNEDFRRLSARDFATTILRDALHTLEVHEGEAFRLGHNAEAGMTELAALGRDLGFTVQANEPVIARGAPISSSRIRKLITAGSLGEARALLGRPFSLHSTPAGGRGYGTRYAVPTINLAPYPELLPANGVYITTLKIGQRTDGPTFRGVTNAGNRPTFGADSFAVETHLLNFQPTGLTETTPLELTFLHRLRDELRFETPEALRTQILTDVAKAHRYFRLCDTLTT